MMKLSCRNDGAHNYVDIVTLGSPAQEGVTEGQEVGRVSGNGKVKREGPREEILSIFGLLF